MRTTVVQFETYALHELLFALLVFIIPVLFLDDLLANPLLALVASIRPHHFFSCDLRAINASYTTQPARFPLLSTAMLIADTNCAGRATQNNVPDGGMHSQLLPTTDT